MVAIAYKQVCILVIEISVYMYRQQAYHIKDYPILTMCKKIKFINSWDESYIEKLLRSLNWYQLPELKSYLTTDNPQSICGGVTTTHRTSVGESLQNIRWGVTTPLRTSVGSRYNHRGCFWQKLVTISARSWLLLAFLLEQLAMQACCTWITDQANLLHISITNWTSLLHIFIPSSILTGMQ